jgi:phi13 family phage major tail protein
MANKIKYGISKCYYSVITYTGDTPSYAAPVALPGAVSLSADAQGDTNTFYADNIAYFTSTANNGYQGDLELALLPDSFRVDVLGEVLDTKGMYVEKANVPTVEFALLFQFEGDESATRHCLYRCTASRPATSGSTKEESIEPQTETITITAMPRITDEVVKSRCPSTATVYADWFTAVTEPTA